MDFSTRSLISFIVTARIAIQGKRLIIISQRCCTSSCLLQSNHLQCLCWHQIDPEVVSSQCRWAACCCFLRVPGCCLPPVARAQGPFQSVSGIALQSQNAASSAVRASPAKFPSPGVAGIHWPSGACVWTAESDHQSFQPALLTLGYGWWCPPDQENWPWQSGSISSALSCDHSCSGIGGVYSSKKSWSVRTNQTYKKITNK